MNSKNEPISENWDDLTWQAFRYLADELSEDERLAFEVLLQKDQQACMALSSMAELSESVFLVIEASREEFDRGAELSSTGDFNCKVESNHRLAFNGSEVSSGIGVRPNQSSQRSSSITLVLCLVAMIAVGIGLSFSSSTFDATSNLVASNSSQAAELVKRWESAAELAAAEIVDENEPAPMTYFQTEDELHTGAVAVQAQSNGQADLEVAANHRGLANEVPDWLLVALRSQAADGESAQAEVMDN